MSNTDQEEQARAEEFRRRVAARARWRDRQGDTLPRGSDATVQPFKESVQPLYYWWLEKDLPADDPWEDL